MKRASIVVLLLALGCLAACGDDAPPPEPDAGPGPAAWTHIVGAGGAVYYLTGPQQAHPPEGTFPPGMRVRLLTEHGSYVRVTSESGQTVYVATDSITPLKP